MLSFGKVKQKKTENRGQKIKWKKYFIALQKLRVTWSTHMELIAWRH